MTIGLFFGEIFGPWPLRLAFCPLGDAFRLVLAEHVDPERDSQPPPWILARTPRQSPFAQRQDMYYAVVGTRALSEVTQLPTIKIDVVKTLGTAADGRETGTQKLCKATKK